MIESLSDRFRGYTEVVAFINRELATPSDGIHSQFIEELTERLVSNDYYLYIQELYSDPEIYYGCLIITDTHKLLVIKDGACTYAQTDPDIVRNLFVLSPFLNIVYSDKIVLQDNSTGEAGKYLQVFLSFMYGAQVIFAYLLDENTVEAVGLLQRRFSEDQSLSGYNVKIDKTLYDTLRMVGARNTYTRFSVEVSEGYYETFTYNRVGEEMFVQDTTTSRESLRFLISKGVVFVSGL